jgi:hypothetical protein
MALALALTLSCNSTDSASDVTAPRSPYAGAWAGFDVRDPEGNSTGLGSFTVSGRGDFVFGTTTLVAGVFGDSGAVSGIISRTSPDTCSYTFVGQASSLSAASGSVSRFGDSDPAVCNWRSFATTR